MLFSGGKIVQTNNFLPKKSASAGVSKPAPQNTPSALAILLANDAPFAWADECGLCIFVGAAVVGASKAVVAGAGAYGRVAWFNGDGQ